MKNNSKSGLRISEIITTLSAFIIVATSTQLFVTNKNSNVEEETQIIQESNLEETKIIETRTSLTRSGISRGDSTQREDEENKTEELNETNKVDEITINNVIANDAKEEISENIEDVEQETNYITIDEVKISKNMDLTINCGLSKEDFKDLMKNLKCDTSGFFYENSDTIYDLCQKYELNEIFFCGLIAGESGWNIASNHRSKCNYISMMSKGKLIKYNTPEEGLEAAAKLLHTKYLSEGGAYYSGKTLASVQKRFCPNSSTWVNLIYGCMKQVIE